MVSSPKCGQFSFPFLLKSGKKTCMLYLIFFTACVNVCMSRCVCQLATLHRFIYFFLFPCPLLLLFVSRFSLLLYVFSYAAIVLPPPTWRTMSYCHHIRTSASIHNLNRFIPAPCDETRIAILSLSSMKETLLMNDMTGEMATDAVMTSERRRMTSNRIWIFCTWT